MNTLSNTSPKLKVILSLCSLRQSPSWNFSEWWTAVIWGHTERKPFCPVVQPERRPTPLPPEHGTHCSTDTVHKTGIHSHSQNKCTGTQVWKSLESLWVPSKCKKPSQVPFIHVCVSQAEMNSNHLKAQGSMMSAVASASVPKITVVIGGCHGADSYAMVSESIYFSV